MNSLLAEMGFDTSLYEFTNVLSIEPWALRMIPQPVAAVMMIMFGSCRTTLNMRAGLLDHVLLNALEGVRAVAIRPDSWLHSFYQDCPVAVSCHQS